ncbi:MAG: hypothetical protein U0074_02810 [Kouleothrix sp.]
MATSSPRTAVVTQLVAAKQADDLCSPPLMQRAWRGVYSARLAGKPCTPHTANLPCAATH